jgi:starch synthase
MRILFATPETCDFVQVGGLAAVSAALPRALLPLADIRIVVPGYPQVLRGLNNLKVVGNSPAFAGLPSFRVGKGHATDGMPYYVVMCSELFERPGSPYGDESGVDWQDNDVRFATFSYAAAQIALGSIDSDWSAHLVHANDWQCALIPAYLEWSQRPLPTVFTIHNLAYQGVFSRDALPRLGIPAQSFHIYAQRFGSLPIGHRTGGLAETILDGQTGFLFERPSSDGLLSSLCRAFSTFGARDRLDRMRRAAMGQAFSWTNSAKAYASLYQSSI